MRVPAILLAAGMLFVTAGCVDSSAQEAGSVTDHVPVETHVPSEFSELQ